MPRARPGVGPGTRRSMTRRVSGRGLGLDFSGGPPGDSGESARPRRRTAVAATAIMMSDPVSRYRQQSQWALGRTQNSRSRVGTRARLGPGHSGSGCTAQRWRRALPMKFSW